MTDRSDDGAPAPLRSLRLARRRAETAIDATAPGSAPRRTVRSGAVLGLGDRAAADLQFIRATMERSGRFTAVPGNAAVAIGFVALAAAPFAAVQETSRRWFAVWAVACLVALAIGITGLIRKARRLEVPILAGPGRRFLLGLCPALLAGALLSIPLLRWGQHRALPPLWLLAYGAGVVSAGATSVSVVPLLGGSLMALGAAALWAPEYGNHLLAAGFGVLHVAAGMRIARKYGG